MRAALFLILWLASPAWAVQPGEMLDDPVLEARARVISQGLRCPICRNESIDESNAALSRDLRVLLRERLVAGDSDAQAVAFIVDRYGEYVLLRPRADGANLILWLSGPAMLLAAMGMGWVVLRRRPDADTGPLSEADKARLDEILRS
jgi:cytochrome c-type biogenesis protein CcmH